MASYRKVIRSTPAHELPDASSSIIFNLEPGQVLEVVSEDDITFSRLIHLGRLVYVSRDDTVHAAPEEVALTQPGSAPVAPGSQATGQQGFCPHCGAAVETSARYCRECGGRLAAASGLVAGANLAGFWIRVAGFLIDAIIAGVIVFGLTAAGISLVHSLDDAPQTQTERSASDDEDETFLAIAIFSPTYLLVGLVYFTAGYATGGTPACRLLRLRILREGGETPGLPHGFVRWLVPFVVTFVPFSFILLPLCYLWAIWDPHRQTWQDKAAGTIVMKR